MHPCIHASMHASSSKFKKKIIACHTSSMIHNVCICITPPTFLRFMKKWKNEKYSKFHSCIHASMYASSYKFKKKIITCHASSNHPSYSTKSLKIISKKVNNENFFVSITNVRHSRNLCRQFKSKIQVLLLYILRPSTRQWSSISLHRGPLWGNGHQSLYIKTICKTMVIDFLCTSRPSVRQWSSISLQQDPLRGNGHWFLMSHRGPLRGNGHRSLYIKTLCEAMIIDFLCHIEAICEAMVIFFFRIGTLYMIMVIESFRYRPSPRDWSNLFFKKSIIPKSLF